MQSGLRVSIALMGQRLQIVGMFSFFIHGIVFILLTVLTQLGGLAWLVACLFRRRLLAFVLCYAGLGLAAVWTAPLFGRTALSCHADGALQVRSWVYCLLNRNYVTPELAAVLHDTAEAMEQAYPGTVTQVLDANFPFMTGFPLLPHLSHHDGRKVDLAFYYADAQTGYLPGRTRSPIGYFAFEQGPTNCPDRWATLRWDLDMLQPLWRDYALDQDRMRSVLEVLSHDNRVGKVFVEPHLKAQLAVQSTKLRFQGCRAARHDDHIHLQL